MDDENSQKSKDGLEDDKTEHFTLGEKSVIALWNYMELLYEAVIR